MNSAFSSSVWCPSVSVLETSDNQVNLTDATAKAEAKAAKLLFVFDGRERPIGEVFYPFPECRYLNVVREGVDLENQDFIRF